MSKILLNGKELEKKIDRFLDRKNNDVFFDDIRYSDKLRAMRRHLMDS